jgi:hypothetical protein
MQAVRGTQVHGRRVWANGTVDEFVTMSDRVVCHSYAAEKLRWNGRTPNKPRRENMAAPGKKS